MNRIVCPVLSIDYYNEDTRTVLLEIPEGEPVPFKAGQYLEIVLPSGKKCPFSIASPPDLRGAVELHVRPTPNSKDSLEIEALLDEGTPVEIEIPKGDCFVERAPDTTLILMAASTGITQMKSIVEHILPARKLEHPVHLYWGVLKDSDLYLDSLCQGWAREEDNFHYIPVVSEPNRSPNWQGRTGLVGDAVLQDFDDLSRVKVIVSGGPAMVSATLDAFVYRGMPDENMASDIFSYAPRQKPD
ncbi:MAG: NAD(P)H-flavin reductase [Pseudomonadales bacterium]|nr:NAD(P)H-flavin reductase [Pseudomonadales bacterium]